MKHQSYEHEGLTYVALHILRAGSQSTSDKAREGIAKWVRLRHWHPRVWSHVVIIHLCHSNKTRPKGGLNLKANKPKKRAK